MVHKAPQAPAGRKVRLVQLVLRDLKAQPGPLVRLPLARPALLEQPQLVRLVQLDQQVRLVALVHRALIIPVLLVLLDQTAPSVQLEQQVRLVQLVLRDLKAQQVRLVQLVLRDLKARLDQQGLSDRPGTQGRQEL
jgi:hypothetical protein